MIRQETGRRNWYGLLGAFVLSLLLASASPVLAQMPTTAELLGYDSDARVLILTADDYGSAHAGNAATRELPLEDRIDSASLMAPCPWFEEAAQFAGSHPEIDVGVHLTLTSEWTPYKWGPVTSRSEVPSLVTERGYFPSELVPVEQNAASEEVRREFVAQIDRVKDRGIEPTHINSHMYSVFGARTGRDFFDVVFELSKQYNLPFRLMRNVPEEMAKILSDEQVARMRTLADSLVREGFVLPDYLDRVDYGESRAETIEWIKERLRNLKPGVTELYIHPAIDSPELQAISEERRDRRVQDYHIFSSEEIHAYIDSLGIERIGWRELQKLQKKRLGSSDRGE